MTYILEPFGFYVDHNNWGRIWKGPFTNESNFHYAYSDGETDIEDRLIWIQASSARPPQTSRASEAQVCALLLEMHWPCLHIEGWEEKIATNIISDIMYNQHISLRKNHLNT